MQQSKNLRVGKEKKYIMENQEINKVVKVGDWIVTYLITAIPIIGLIMLFVWAFSEGTNPNKANWAKAILLWFAILIGFYLVIATLFGSVLFSIFH